VFVASVLLASAAASAATGYVSGRTKMRAGPDNGYPVVDTIRRGEGLTLHGCLSDWSWCDVGYRGARGWVPANRILGETVSGRVPVVSNGPSIGVSILGFNLDQYWDTYYNGRFDRKRGQWQKYYREHHRSSWDNRDHGRDHDHDWRRDRH
jgi:uncharacterized protein YraI